MGHACARAAVYVGVVALVDDTRDSPTRRAGGWGLAFVVLLLIGAGMATVPGGDDPVAQVRHFYEEHTHVVLLSQGIEFLATLPLVLFLLGLATSTMVRARRAAMLIGGALVLASLLTLIPPLLLVLRHDRGSAGEVHALAILSDLTDVLLFATIAAFAVVCGWAGQGPTWLRWLALFVGITAGARAVEILFGGGLLEVLAPLGFIALVVAFSVLLLRRGRRAGSPPSRGRPSADHAQDQPLGGDGTPGHQV
jgi:hypothetical protein